MQSFAPAMLAAAYGLTPLAGATLLTAFLLSSAAGILVGGFVASSIAHHERAAALGMAGGAVTFALLATSSPPVGLLGPLLCAGGFALGTAYPSRDMLVRAAAPKGAIGRTFGVVYCGTDIGAALGPGAIGWLLDHGRPDWSFLSVALVLAANIVLAYQATRRRIQPVTLPA
jgi:MFS family permease